MTVADDQLPRIGSVLDEWDHQDAASLPIERLRDRAEVTNMLFEALQPIIAITIKLGVGPTPGSDREEDATWATNVALARRDVLANQIAEIDHGLAGGNLRLLERIDALIVATTIMTGSNSFASGSPNASTHERKGVNAASSSGDSTSAILSLNRGNRCRSGGRCVIRLTTGCVRRPRRSPTQRVEA